uniref:Polyribonucleotide nucleotidyltransferase n=1 Tax=Tetraselmis sp. GSL018 TaxID=582737 RepID=A0A061QIX5_9CHLO
MKCLAMLRKIVNQTAVQSSLSSMIFRQHKLEAGLFVVALPRLATTSAAHPPYTGSVSDPLWLDRHDSSHGDRATASVGPVQVSFHTSTLSNIADGAALVAQGRNRAMAAVVVDPRSSGLRPSQRLQFDYTERACASGNFPTTSSKREGGPRETCWSRSSGRCSPRASTATPRCSA